METITRDAIPAVRKMQATARDTFAVCTMSEFATLAETSGKALPARRDKVSGNWYGNKTYATSLAQMRDGDMSGVAASDKIMDAIEFDAPMTQAWRNTMDVVGGVPNVPAFLAGHPQCMRRRERVASEQAPLAIFVSLELSANISVDVMRKRGVALLALVRRLSNVRPVELLVCCSVGNDAQAAHVVVRVDTSPLDLARAAHLLTCPSVTRGLGYVTCAALLKKHLGKSWSGDWAYGNCSLYRDNAKAIFASVAPPSSDVLYVPAAHGSDKAVTNPTQWMADMIAQYGGAL